MMLFCPRPYFLPFELFSQFFYGVGVDKRGHDRYNIEEYINYVRRKVC